MDVAVITALAAILAGFVVKLLVIIRDWPSHRRIAAARAPRCRIRDRRWAATSCRYSTAGLAVLSARSSPVHRPTAAAISSSSGGVTTRSDRQFGAVASGHRTDGRARSSCSSATAPRAHVHVSSRANSASRSGKSASRAKKNQPETTRPHGGLGSRPASSHSARSHAVASAFDRCRDSRRRNRRFATCVGSPTLSEPIATAKDRSRSRSSGPVGLRPRTALDQARRFSRLAYAPHRHLRRRRGRRRPSPPRWQQRCARVRAPTTIRPLAEAAGRRRPVRPRSRRGRPRP